MRQEIGSVTNRIRRYCCWVKNPLSKEGIVSEKQWVDATDLLDAAFQYFRKTGAYPTDVLSEDSAKMEERLMGGVYGYFHEPTDTIRQELALTKRKLEVTEERVESLQAQRDNFAHSYEVLSVEYEALLTEIWIKLDRSIDQSVAAMQEINRLRGDTGHLPRPFNPIDAPTSFSHVPDSDYAFYPEEGFPYSDPYNPLEDR